MDHFTSARGLCAIRNDLQVKLETDVIGWKEKGSKKLFCSCYIEEKKIHRIKRLLRTEYT